MRRIVLLLAVFLIVLSNCSKKIDLQKMIEQSVGKATMFIEKSQQGNGDIPSKVCKDPKQIKCMTHKGSVFSTTFILYSLNFLKEIGPVEKIIAKGLSFIDSKKEKDDLWRFWGSRIDPDLDDTSCSSFLFKAEKKNLINSEMIYRNRDGSGVFKTWVRKEQQNDIEGVVNANVLLYLGENEKTTPACNWIVKAILEGRDDDILHYYSDKAVLFYTLSRAYDQHKLKCVKKDKPLIIELVRKDLEKYKKDKDYLNLAFSLNALLNFGLNKNDLQKYVEFFLNGQNKDGSWDSSLFFLAVDLPVKKPSSYFFSKEVTTALVGEFLFRVK